ncbi:hypothetical protein PG984_010178 [Apiospora sp. TS-2023a]
MVPSISYATVDGGYKCNAETLKLVCADGSRIDNSLVFTCKQVAEEMTGVGFRCNTLNFTTFYSDAMRVTAARWDGLWEYHQAIAAGVFGAYIGLMQGEEWIEIAQAWINEIAQKHPDYAPVLQALLEREDDHGMFLTKSWGLNPSACAQALFYSLQAHVDTLGKNPEAHKRFQKFQDHVECGFRLVLDGARPWQVPSTDQVDLLVKYIIDHKEKDSPLDQWLRVGYWDSPHVSLKGNKRYTQGKYRFSAASVAHTFLSRLPERLRTHLRNLHIHEDHTSVASPYYHAQGLVPFCLDNPRLRILHRIDMWRTIVATPYKDSLYRDTPEQWFMEKPLLRFSGACNLATWLGEALALPSHGMPQQSYTLLLDASQSREQCTSFFQDLIQRHAVWQEVWERVAIEEDVGWLEVRSAQCYIAAGFPQAVADIANNVSPMVQTTFDASQGDWDAEAVYLQSLDRRLEEVEKPEETELVEAWDPVQRDFVGLTRAFEFKPPLPSYEDLLAENILPEFFTEQDWSRVDEDDSGESDSEADDDDDDDGDADDDDEDDDADADADSEDEAEGDDEEAAAAQEQGDESDDDDAIVYHSDHSD